MSKTCCDSRFAVSFQIFKIILALGILGIHQLPRTAYATVDNTHCRIATPTDNPSEPFFGSLRRYLAEGFNRAVNRACTESIEGVSGQPTPVQALDTFEIDASGDFDRNTEGFNLVITGVEENLVVDAMDMPEGKCLFHAGPAGFRIQLKNMIIHIHRRADAFCGDAEIATANVTILSEDPPPPVQERFHDTSSNFTDVGILRPSLQNPGAVQSAGSISVPASSVIQPVRTPAAAKNTSPATSCFHRDARGNCTW